MAFSAAGEPVASPRNIFLVGAGRVGTAVTALLRRRGHAVVGVASRSSESAARAAEFLETSAFDNVPSVWPSFDLLLIGASDSAIGTVAQAVAPHLPVGAIVSHFAGSLGTDVLADCERAGALTGALHPVQACPSVGAGVARLPGSAWGITGTDDLWRWASAIVSTDLSGTPFRVAEADRPLWHAASVITSNAIVALLGSSGSLLNLIGCPDPMAVLGPLAAGTVENARTDGAGTALTGPIVRGDLATIERHVAALAGHEELGATYAAAARMIIAGARASGRVDAGTLRAVEELIGRL